MQKRKLLWVTRESSAVGNAFGYRTHNSYMKKYCEKYFEYSDDADIALHIVPADHFQPIKGKFNILFTMWEFMDVPLSYVKGLNKADMIIVPCKFCKDVFANVTRRPIYVCHEGVDAEKYPYKERQYFRGNTFRFLWVGAANPRKGYPIVLDAIKAFADFPKIEIYLKTTAEKFNRRKTITNIWHQRERLRANNGREFIQRALLRSRTERNGDGVYDKLIRHGKHNNVIFDTRILPLDELIDLYHSAHCFILPSFGEGWGLTLCEAMATGAPCVSVDYTGCAEFFDDKVGYALKHEIRSQELRNYDIVARGHCPDTRDLVMKMLYVIENYGEAIKKGKKAHDRITTKFTWEKAAYRLNDIIRCINIQDKRKAA